MPNSGFQHSDTALVKAIDCVNILKVSMFVLVLIIILFLNTEKTTIT